MKNNKGFSLVELIVVIAIMAILAAVAVVSFSIYIDRANDAADFDYLSNVAYFAELYAIENQLGLDSIVVSEDGVHGPEDIGLLIIIPGEEERQLLTGEQIREIYDAVGDWEFKGEGFKDKVDDIPNVGDTDLDDANNGLENCQHSYSVTTTVPSTCQRKGYVKKTCQNPQCRREVVESLDLVDHNFSDTPTYEKGKYDYFICTYDGCNKIKIMSSDGSVIVPIQ